MSEDFIHAEDNQADESAPEQKYFKIAEASDLLGVKPHVLRYWESEFPQIRPYKSKSGQRLYRRRDFEALKHVHRLLYQERCTIASARQALRLLLEKEQREQEPVLSAQAVEMAVDMPLPFVSQKAEMPREKASHCVQPTQTLNVALDSEPSLRILQRKVPSIDVLELVEQKMANAQVRERLELVKMQLQEMIEILAV